MSQPHTYLVKSLVLTIVQTSIGDTSFLNLLTPQKSEG